MDASSSESEMSAYIKAHSLSVFRKSFTYRDHEITFLERKHVSSPMTLLSFTFDWFPLSGQIGSIEDLQMFAQCELITHPLTFYQSQFGFESIEINRKKSFFFFFLFRFKSHPSLWLIIFLQLNDLFSTLFLLSTFSLCLEQTNSDDGHSSRALEVFLWSSVGFVKIKPNQFAKL